jgi:hypothetical protein
MVSRFHLALISLRKTSCLFMATPVALHAAGVAQEIYKSAFVLLDIAP